MDLSFITVSRDSERLLSLQESLDATFGCTSPYAIELIRVDGERYDLFRGYNEGAARAHGDVLIFLHDDVRLLGNHLTFRRPLELLADHRTGFLGVAGTTHLTASGRWWDAPAVTCRGAVARPANDGIGVQWGVWPRRAGRFGPVAVLDGLLMMGRRHVLERLGRFADAAYRGFHFYDMDLTLRATLEGLINYAVPIPVFHGSRGCTDAAWEQNRRVFLQRFAPYLPYRLPDALCGDARSPCAERAKRVLLRGMRCLPFISGRREQSRT